MDERNGDAWVSLVLRSSKHPDVAVCLERHSVSLTRIKWIHGHGRAALPEAGVYLHLEKPATGRRGEVSVRGVEFALQGMRGGVAYAGSLPLGIQRSESMMDIGMKLYPAMLTPGAEADTFDAVFPEHRLVMRFDGERLQSLAWVTTREFDRNT